MPDRLHGRCVLSLCIPDRALAFILSLSRSHVSTVSEQDEARTQETGITTRMKGRRKHRRPFSQVLFCYL